jgi:Arc/MetJ-type ribon-helix-helix transcriptional regulator
MRTGLNACNFRSLSDALREGLDLVLENRGKTERARKSQNHSPPATVLRRDQTGVEEYLAPSQTEMSVPPNLTIRAKR